MTDEVVSRLHRCLVEELQKRGHPQGRPLKVSQLYQDVVPYRAVRSALQVELNADYEHALLRLLAGERGLLRIEPEDARRELEREVAEPYPFVGLFRKFSAADVWVDLPPGRALEEGQPEGPESSEDALVEPALPPPANGDGPEVVTPLAPGAATNAAPQSEPPIESPRLRPQGGGPALAAARAPVQLHLPPPVPPPEEDHGLALVGCVFCDGRLPTGRRVRFCPFCGADQRLRPCPRCDAVLERDWHYCISCGHEQG